MKSVVVILNENFSTNFLRLNFRIYLLHRQYVHVIEITRYKKVLPFF